MSWTPAFVRRRPAVWAILVFCLIALPGGVDAWLSLWEKYRAVRQGAVASFHLGDWWYPASVLVGFAMLTYILVVVWRDRRRTVPPESPARIAAEHIPEPGPRLANPFHAQSMKRLIGVWADADKQWSDVVERALQRLHPEADPLKLLRELVLEGELRGRDQERERVRDLGRRLDEDSSKDEESEAAYKLRDGIERYCRLARISRRLTGSLIPRQVWREEHGRAAQTQAKELFETMRSLAHTDLNVFAALAERVERFALSVGPLLELAPAVEPSLLRQRPSDAGLCFAVIRVTNEGNRNLSVVAQVDTLERRERCGAWWLEGATGGRLVANGNDTPISVGATRMLVLAVRSYNPEEPASDRDDKKWYAVHTEEPGFYADMLNVVSNGVHLDERVRFRVRFRAEGVNQVILCEASTDKAGRPVFKRVEEGS